MKVVDEWLLKVNALAEEAEALYYNELLTVFKRMDDDMLIYLAYWNFGHSYPPNDTPLTKMCKEELILRNNEYTEEKALALESQLEKFY